MMEKQHYVPSEGELHEDAVVRKLRITAGGGKPSAKKKSDK